ncbi:Olfactory receptor 51E1 D-GPCR G-protein coupled receptor 164 [Collichthys lucidus]|uniref:Olfactory receptor n=1 Tax=Collichthys lucidus TaxID=240159 RepID=A0A4U5U3J6_COLLU|nr:Olfactory receptor 51E1 D-GPCR G-protein coupled receptor 164 [Collichthys lucidus]
MENSNVSFYFNLTVFMNIGHYRYLAFVFCLLLYSFIMSANLAMMWIILRERTLHEPMYIFIAILSANALYGSTGFFPRFLMDLLSDIHLISHPACFTQIFVIYTYASYEVTILSIMAYDRYIAICHALHYHRRMNSKAVYKLAFFAWVCPTCSLTIVINITISLPLCGNNIQKAYCASWNIVKLSCNTFAINNTVTMLGAVIVGFLPFVFILYTYLRIVIACWKMSSEVRAKVLQSCLPHVISFVVYSITSCSDTALGRQNLDEINPFVALILSLEFVVIPPFLNPLIYGLKLPEIRRHIVNIFKHF